MKKSVMRVSAIGLSALLLASCGSEAGGDDADKPSEAAPPEATASPAQAAADLPGKVQFLQCAACHAVEANAAPKVGPNLHCVIGRGAAALEGFTYSAAFKQAGSDGVVWDRAKLLEFMERPMSVVPGNSMAFGGVAKAEDREAIADYIAANCDTNGA